MVSPVLLLDLGNGKEDAQAILPEAEKIQRKLIQEIFSLKICSGDLALAMTYASFLDPSSQFDCTNILQNLPKRVSLSPVPDTVPEIEITQYPQKSDLPEVDIANRDYQVYRGFQNTDVYRNSSFYQKIALWILTFGLSSYSSISAGFYRLTGKRISLLEGSLIPIRFTSEKAAHSLLDEVYHFSFREEFEEEMADFLAETSSTFFNAYAESSDKKNALAEYLQNHNRSQTKKISEEHIFNDFFGHLLKISLNKRKSWPFFQSSAYKNRFAKFLVSFLRLLLDTFDNLLYRLISWGVSKYGPSILQCSIDAFRKKLTESVFQHKLLIDCKRVFEDLTEQSIKAKQEEENKSKSLTTKLIKPHKDTTTVRLATTSAALGSILLNSTNYKPFSAGFLPRLTTPIATNKAKEPSNKGWGSYFFDVLKTPTKSAKRLSNWTMGQLAAHLPGAVKWAAGLQHPKKDLLNNFLHQTLIEQTDIFSNRDEFRKILSKVLDCSLANFPTDKSGFSSQKTHAAVPSIQVSDITKAREDALIAFINFMQEYSGFPVKEFLQNEGEHDNTFLQALNEFSQDFCRLFFEEKSFTQLLFIISMKTFNEYAEKTSDLRKALRSAGKKQDLELQTEALKNAKEALSRRITSQLAAEQYKNGMPNSNDY